MTVFKTFWNIVKKNKMIVILYTVIVIVFGGLNQQANENNMTFSNVKPDVLIVNKDEEVGLTKNLIEYIKNHAEIKDIKDEEDAIDDALFYRDVNYIIYIPKSYREDVLASKNPQIEVKSTKDYEASLEEMLLSRYLKLQSIYLQEHSEEEAIELINANLANETNIEISSSIDTAEVTKVTYYFNFASYSIMAIIIYIICIVLSSFNELTVKKRTIISSMSYRSHNRKILLSSLLFALIVWIAFSVLGVVFVGTSVLSARGLICILNALIFTIVSLTLAILISTIINNKDAISGIVNVIALGQAFLCGAFVPASWLPDFVLKIAHVLPAYWFINSNDLLVDIEKLNLESLKPIITNSLVLIVFVVLFIILNNIVSKYKQKIG